MKAATVFLLLIVATGFAVLGYSSWQQQESFSCSSVGTTNLIYQVISKNIGRSVRDPEEKIRIDNIAFNLTDIITVSDGKQAKRCQAMIAVPVPTSIPATETFSGLREVAHVQVEGRTLLVPITYEAKLTDNREKEYVSIDDVRTIVLVLWELAKPADVPSDKIDAEAQVVIAKAEALNDKCRDSPNNPESCAERDKLFEELRERGYCFGHEPQAMFERQWEKCR